MGKNNKQTCEYAKSFLGKGGATFRSYCGLPSGAAWCDAFVTYIFHKTDNASLFCGGKKQTYCPTTIKLLRKEMAEIPLYLAMPMDVIFFDWDRNGVPNHIGFVRAKNTTDSIYTIEGNTSNKVMLKTRPRKYVCGVFRPHYKATFTLKKLTVDGDCGYNTIAVLQKYLGVTVDGILGLNTVKALQKKVGVSADGAWGTGTSKAVQKLVGTTADGAFGKNSVKALQTFLNKKVFPSVSGTTTATKPTTQSAAQTKAQKAVAWGRSIIKGGKYKYKKWNNKDKNTKICPICHKLASKYQGWNCIGFVSACFFHGAGVKSVTCSCSGIGTDSFFTKVTEASWKKRNGNSWKMITNGGSKGGADIPASKLIAGDVLICYTDKGKFKHIALYAGNGKILESTKTRTPNVGERTYKDLCSRHHVTRAFRYKG